MGTTDQVIDRETHIDAERRDMGDRFQTYTVNGECLLYAGGNRFLIRDTRAALIEKHKAKSRAILKGDMQ